MKPISVFIRLFVGILFVFSGLVKANDPKGLSYKMQEFFEVWGLHGWDNYTLPLAVVLNTAEIFLGIAFLLSWKPKLINKSIFGLLIFFTLLTGYTYWTGLPKNCGCFGDCLPITPLISFLKDIFLLILLFISFKLQKSNCGKQYIAYRGFYSLLAGVLALLLQWFVLTHLPLIDCLPFKKGADLVEGRKMPANAIPDSTIIYFTYQKGDQAVQFPANRFPADFSSSTYKFVKREDRLIRKGENWEPPIKGFYLTGVTNIDSTDYVLSLPTAILIIVEKAKDVVDNLPVLDRLAYKEYYPAASVFIVTAQFEETRNFLSSTRFSGWPVFKCDLKAIQTAARTSPCIYLLSNGKVVRKKVAKDF